MRQDARTFYFGTEPVLILAFIGVVSILYVIASPMRREEKSVVVTMKAPPQPEVQVVKIGQKELVRLRKISQSIPVKLISGKIPAKAIVGPGGTTDFSESVYDFGRMIVVTSFSATPACGGSGATNAELSLFLSRDKARWVLVGRSTGCNALNGTTKLEAGYAKWRVGIKPPFTGPASIFLQDAPVLMGYTK